MAAKKTEITYTPDELAEIERIINVISEEPSAHIPEIKPRKLVPSDEDEEPAEEFDIEHYDSDIPSDLSMEEDIFEKPAGKKKSREDEYDFSVDENEPIEEIKEEEIEDITDIISEADTGGEKPGEEEVFSLSDDDISFIDETETMPAKDKAAGADEFEEFEDITDITEPVQEKKGKKKPDTIALESEDEMEIPDLDEISLSESAEIPEAEEKDIPEIDFQDLDKGAKTSDSFEDIEDLGAMEMEDFHEEIPVSEKTESEKSPIDEFESFDEAGFEDIEDVSDFSVKTSADKKSRKPEIEPLQDEFETEIHEPAEPHEEEESLTIEPLDEDGFDHLISEEEPAKAKTGKAPRAEETTSEIELSEKDLARLKKAIVLFNPAIRQAIRDTIINDKLSPDDTRKLVDMIITGKPEDNIQKYLEKKLKIKIELADEVAPGRRVLATRPEYTLEGRERQKKLLKLTKIFSISAVLACTLTILSYQFIYKPVMAKRMIHKGVEIILKSGMAGSRFERKSRYDEAERIFKEVDEEYAKDYLYGYNEYARAYLQNSDYKESLEKLNKAYTLNRTHIDTLNNLGYFYAKINNEYFMTLAKDIRPWYFGDRKDIETIKTPLDLSINFYRRVLLLDKENVTALLGIGNAYFYQGQYLKAKKYYEDILRVDPDSVVGYSGLLNLYIERDAFPQVATLHADLRNKEMLPEIPSPLLAKLAGYYLEKRKKDDSSIRIDYGVQSKKLIDENDNTYPAIIEVLKALNERDQDYPQLHILFAKLNMAQNNLAAMKRYIDKALDLSPEYYSALHLLGEYYYSTKEPVKAYKYLKDAVDKYGNQPQFTKDDFYKETESIGKTNAYLGNIFYYFFDKVKSRKEALDEEIAENEIDKMANYTIAQQYYLNAANLNYDSPELHYNLGRIYYMKKSYSLALSSWLHLYDDFVKSPEIMISLGNAFYYNNNINAAKGEYLKLISVMEYEADKIKVVDTTRIDQVKTFQSLASAYNNLGVVYNDLNDNARRDLAFWKAIEYASKLGQQNEYARVNMARTYRKEDVEKHLLDESIPYSIAYYREEMRN